MDTTTPPTTPSAQEGLECLTPDQGRALAYLVTGLRPDWQTPGVLAAIREASTTTRDPAAVMLAAISAARVPTNKTPRVIALPGGHWPAPRGSEASVGGLQDLPPCADHPTHPAHRCPACIADVKVGDRPAGWEGRPLAEVPRLADGAWDVGAVREALRVAPAG